MGDSHQLQVLETEILDVKPDRTSKSGTPYCAVVIQSPDSPGTEWVFVWDGPWKDDVEDRVDEYRGLDARLYVRDKEDDPDDHFYNLEAVVPQDPETNRAWFRRDQEADGFEPASEERRRELEAMIDEVYA